MTPSLLHVAACKPSDDRHTPRTSDLVMRKNNGREEERGEMRREETGKEKERKIEKGM